MALYLQPDVALSIREGNVVLERCGVPVSHVLGIAEAIALACLGATGDEAEAATICDSVFGSGSAWLERTINRYWTYLGGDAPRVLDREWLNSITQLRPRFPTLPASNIKREAAPSAITWMVTLGCNRKCPYCFFPVYGHAAESKESPPDATFPLANAVRMVHEMAKIGAADLYLTGGEPLLRRDLLELIEEASRVRVRTHITTKYAISPSMATRLLEAGVTEVAVSLDDARPLRAAALAGSRGYLSEAEQTIRNLVAAGIRLEVNAVLTKVNARHLRQLAAYLVELNVRRLRLSPFHAPYPHRRSAGRLSAPNLDLTELETLRRDFADRQLEIVLSAGASPAAPQPCGSLVCEIGTSALDVMPDGSVSRCHYITGDSRMTVGSLLDHSLLEIWNGAPLASLTRPPRASFGNTACASCGGHDACNARGRCYVSALQINSNLYAPDAFCTRQ